MKLKISGMLKYDGRNWEMMLDNLGMKVGRNCKISPHAQFYGLDRIEIGDNVRIDDFCIISAGKGGIKIGSNIHIAAHCFMAGAAEIQIDDYVGVGVRSVIHSSSDDFSGNYLIGPQLSK